MTFRDRRPWARMFENQLPEYIELVVPEDLSDREEAEFTVAMVRQLNEQLKGQGLGVFFFGPNIMNTGYRVGFLDAAKRRYYAGFTHDEAIALAENYPGNGFQELLKLMCERALLERALQFAKQRANDALSLTLDEVVQESTPS